METKDYVEKMKMIYNNVIEYLENEDSEEKDFKELIDLFQDSNVIENKQDLKKTLSILIKIADNHIRTTSFFPKIESILTYFKESITNTFSNFEIFRLFKNNKRLLLFLIEEKMINIDRKIIDIFLHNKKYEGYLSYFYPEIKDNLGKETRLNIEKTIENFDLFEENRKIGENDHEICNLIRTDSVNDFIICFNKNNISVNDMINSSIYETNQYLLKKQPSIIEYATFYGSIEIIQYLISNNARLNSSLWNYAVHGNNPEIINLLEDKNVNTDDDTYEEYFFESIKCHHNNFAQYFQDNYRDYLAGLEKLELLSVALKYHNFKFFSDCFRNKYAFYDLCKYDYFQIVENVMKSLNFNIKSRIIFKNRKLQERKKIIFFIFFMEFFF